MADQPRLNYVEPAEAADSVKQHYDTMATALGSVPNVVKVMGHSEGATAGLSQVLHHYFANLALDPSLRELAYLSATAENGCHYCQSHHQPLAIQTGWHEAQLALLNEQALNSNQFNDAAKAVIRFARETTNHVRASDDTFQALKAHFDEQQIAAITFVVATANFVQRMGKNLDVTLEG